MKIFITGASGFIGTELLKQLQGTEHEVVCLVRKSSSNFEKLASSGIKVVEGDIRDKASILRGMKGCDWVVHLAGLYSFWEKNNNPFREINVEGTKNVMESALESNIKKVAHVSTVAVYGKTSEVPFTETCKAGNKLASHYSKTKFEGGKIAWDFYENNNLPLVVIYPAVVLGAGNPKTSGLYVSDIVNKRMPAQVFKNVPFTWVHVKNVAEGIVKAMEKADNIGEKYIIGKEMITLGELNKMISEISGVTLPKITMPAWLAIANSRLLTGISRITGIQPPLRMYSGQIITMSMGIPADGSKAEKELGISYIPVRKALEAEISELK